MNPRPDIGVQRETPSALLLKRDRGSGVLTSVRAMRWCIEHAQAQHGIACAGVRQAGHVIASAPYVVLHQRHPVYGFDLLDLLV